MTHKVRDWMSSPVIVVDSDSSVSYALTLMRRRNIHSLVVLLSESEGQYGILTTTDIRDKIFAKEQNPAEMRVRELMSAPISAAKPDWTLTECSRVMMEKNIHHMPVCDENENLVGMISATDLFIAAEEIGWEGD
jgi:CBS domain-containing protein